MRDEDKVTKQACHDETTTFGLQRIDAAIHNESVDGDNGAAVPLSSLILRSLVATGPFLLPSNASVDQQRTHLEQHEALWHLAAAEMDADAASHVEVGANSHLQVSAPQAWHSDRQIRGVSTDNYGGISDRQGTTLIIPSIRHHRLEGHDHTLANCKDRKVLDILQDVLGMTSIDAFDGIFETISCKRRRLGDFDLSAPVPVGAGRDERDGNRCHSITRK